MTREVFGPDLPVLDKAVEGPAVAGGVHGWSRTGPAGTGGGASHRSSPPVLVVYL
jgi:hypothetical protein